jgi:hypothetical protein
MDVLPLDKIPYDPYMPDIIEAFFAAGSIDKAVEMTNALCNHYYEQLDYYLEQTPYIISSADYEIQSALQYTSSVAETCINYQKQDLGLGINAKLRAYYSKYLVKQQPAKK